MISLDINEEIKMGSLFDKGNARHTTASRFALHENALLSTPF